MKSKDVLGNVCDWRKVAMAGAVSGLVVVGGMSVSCGRKSQAEEGKKKLELVGYELNQAGFFKAAAQDDLAALKIFKEQNFDFRVKDSKGQSAVHVAAEADAVRALAYLEKNDLNLDALNNDQQTALMLAAGKANLESLEFLLKAGVETRIRDGVGKFALLYAVDAESDAAIRVLAPHTRELLDTALLYAADQNKAGAVEPLVQYGGSVYARNQGLTSLMIASEKGNAEVVKVLIEHGANAYAVSDDGKLARDFAHEDEAVLGALQAVESADSGAAGDQPAQSDDEDQELVLEWNESELEEVVKQAMVRYHEQDLEKFAAQQEAADVAQNEALAETTPKAGDAVAENGSAGQKPSMSPSAGGDAIVALPPVPVAPEKVEVKRLQGRELAVDLSDDEELNEELMMSAYAEKPLPVIMQADEAGNVTVRDLREADAKPKVVKEGSTIGMTGLKVTQIKKKIVNSKMTGGVDKELVTMIIEDEHTGKTREIYSGYESVASDAVAVVRLKGTNEHLIVTRGDSFTDAKGVMYKVIDVSKSDISVENSQTGKVTLLPLLGIKRVVE